MEDFGQLHLRPDLHGYRPAGNLAQNDAIRARQAAGELSLVNLGFGQSPFPIPAFAVDLLRQAAADARYLPSAGTKELREAVSRFHAEFDDLPEHASSPSRVVCGPGSKELIYLIMAVTRGDVYICSPSWTTYAQQAALAGRAADSVVRVDLKPSGWKLTPRALENAMKNRETCGGEAGTGPCRLLVFNNPDNPTGMVYTDPELLSLAVCLRRHRFLVISDEIYARLVFPSQPQHASLASHYPEGTIVTSGISKWAGAGGWRLGYALFPRQLAGSIQAAVESAATHTFTCCSAPVQFAAAGLLGNRQEAAKHSRRCALVLEALAQQCCDQLRSAGAQVGQPHGGFYMMPDFEVARSGLSRLLNLPPSSVTGPAMCQRILSDTGVALMPAGPTFQRPEQELTVRLCFVEFDGAAALEAVEGMESAGEPLPVDFAARFCQPTHSAVARLAQWLRDVQQLQGNRE